MADSKIKFSGKVTGKSYWMDFAAFKAEAEFLAKREEELIEDILKGKAFPTFRPLLEARLQKLKEDEKGT